MKTCPRCKQDRKTTVPMTPTLTGWWCPECHLHIATRSQP